MISCPTGVKNLLIPITEMYHSEWPLFHIVKLVKEGFCGNKDSVFLFLFFFSSLKVWVAMMIYRRNERSA